MASRRSLRGRVSRAWQRALPQIDPALDAARRGHALVQMGRSELAVELLERATASAPADFRLPMVLCHAYRKLERLEEAEGAARRAIALSPGLSHLYGHLAYTLIAQTRYRDAYEAAVAGCRAGPVDPHTFLAASDAARLCGERASASEYARAYVAARADSVQPLGVALLAHASWREAEEILRQAHAQRPDFCDAPTYLAFALIPQGRVDEASELALGSVRINPRWKLGRALWERLVAFREAEASLRADPNPARRAELVRLLITQGRLDEAERALESLEAEPAEELRRELAVRRRADREGIPSMTALELELRAELLAERILTAC